MKTMPSLADRRGRRGRRQLVSRGPKGQSGRSLLEMLVVIAITACVAVVALPNVLMSYEQFRLSSAATDLSTMIQRTRAAAVSQNAPAALQFSTSSTVCSPSATFWIDLNTNGSVDANEMARYCLSRRISVATSTSSVPSTINDALLGNMSSVTVNVASSSVPVYFNARGVPCQYNSTNKTCSAIISGGATASSWVYYLYDAPYLGSNGWAAVTVTPAGRVKVWRWDGSAWK